MQLDKFDSVQKIDDELGMVVSRAAIYPGVHRGVAQGRFAEQHRAVGYEGYAAGLVHSFQGGCVVGVLSRKME